MLKRDELSDPNSCMNRAKDDELTFVLLGRDAAAPIAIRAWCLERIRLGKNEPGDEQIQEAMQCAAAMGGTAKGVVRLPKLEVAPDVSIVRCNIEACIAALKDGDGRPKSREIALAVTKLQEAFMWLDEHNRVS